VRQQALLINTAAAWIAYLNVAILLGTFSLALFNASRDQVARNFAYAYAVISVGILVRHGSKQLLERL
jgi:hypothetical protein